MIPTEAVIPELKGKKVFDDRCRVSVPCLFILNLLSVNPKSFGNGIPKTKNKKTDMKKLIMKLLGLESLVTELDLLKKQNEEFTNRIKHLDDEVNALEERVQEKIDEIEIPDMDDYISESDLDDRIETYLNDNEYVTSSYVTDEIENNVSEKVESAVEDLDISDKVKEVVEEMDKASFGDTEELKAIVIKVLKTLKFKVE